MIYNPIKSYFSTLDLKQKQINNIIMITFWSQFSVYALSSILILFLTRPVLSQGLGYTQAHAYVFMGVAQALAYLMPILGGYMADTLIGIRRSILLGSMMLALAYLAIMLSAFSIHTFGDKLFIAAYALIPATNSLLSGTASSMVYQIYSDDAIAAKSALTYYYMAINLGALLGAFIAPMLLNSVYGPLSVFAFTFIGKTLAALNFAKNYSIYDNLLWGKDQLPFPKQAVLRLISYLFILYAFTLFAYSQVTLAIYLISIGCGLGIFWFIVRTFQLQGAIRSKQIIGILLIIEAVVFFIIYNQMNSTLVLFAQSNSNLNLLGFTISAAQYQMLNPLLILLIGSQLPRFYQKYSKFIIPYQFASGTILAGLALLLLAFAASRATQGLVNGNYLALTYILISIAELWVSAIGFSMIGLYCDGRSIAFAMGVWYLASSLSNTISSKIATWVAIPETMNSMESLFLFKRYYFYLGLTALCLGAIMLVLAYGLQKIMKHKKIDLV